MRKRDIKLLIWVYLGAWLLSFLLLLLQLYPSGESFVELVSIIFTQIFLNRTFLLLQHLFFILCYLLVLGIRYLVRTYRKKGWRTSLRHLGLGFLLPLGLIFGGFKGLVYTNSQEISDYVWDEQLMNQTGRVARHFEADGLHRGMSVFGWGRDNNKLINDLVRSQIEWVAIVPFLYQDDAKSATMGLPKKGSLSRQDSIFVQSIRDAHDNGLYVHLKPHLWMGDGWRSDVNHSTDAQWATWFASYRTNMLHYAQMAQDTGVELFCVGTELRSSIKKQPEAWSKLISEIRQIYDGKLTYAANWHDEYEHISFWDQLDYIGIQAYFPLTKGKNPELSAIKKGWQPHINSLEAFSKKYRKPILFTEVGYKNEASATIRPWEWAKFLGILFQKKSERTQRLAYEALFEELWHQEWFAGIYIWEWQGRSTPETASKRIGFSPQYKEAENAIAKWFGKVQ